MLQELRLVDSCTGTTVEVDSIGCSVENGVQVGALSFVARRHRRGLRSAAELRPDGTYKYRWTCPADVCTVDVTLSTETLNRVLVAVDAAGLADTHGVASLELSALAAMLS